MSKSSISSICLIRTASISRLERFFCFLQCRDEAWHISSPLPPFAKWCMYVEQHSLDSPRRFCLNYLKLVCCGFADSGWDPSSWFGILQWWLLRSQNFPKAFPDKQKARDTECLTISLKGLCILGRGIHTPVPWLQHRTGLKIWERNGLMSKMREFCMSCAFRYSFLLQAWATARACSAKLETGRACLDPGLADWIVG